MYLIERLIWAHRTQPRGRRDRLDEDLAKEFGPSHIIYDPEAKAWGIHESVGARPYDAGSLYAVNDIFLDVRSAFQEEKRGLITFGFLGLFGVWLYFIVWKLCLHPGFYILFLGRTPWARPIQVGDYIFVWALFVCSCLVFWAFFKYAWPWVRVEVFTQRHLIARFNRQTRQVYLNRPSYAGGNVVLAWESAVAAIDPDEPDHLGIGGFLAVVFSKKNGPSDFEDFVFLGRPMRGNREIEGLWEYIRRYMEDGPDAVPKPKRLLPLWPSPVEAVRATFRFISPMWRSSSKLVALLTGLVLSPLLVLHALCHWISLLLCWRPYWPKEIREAGLPGKPVPRLTEIDDFGPELAKRIRYNDRKDEGSTKPKRRRKKKAVTA